MPAKLTLTKNFGVKRSTEYSWTMEEIKAFAQEMSILCPKTSKKLYHQIKFRESIMNNEVFYKKSVLKNFIGKHLRWTLFFIKKTLQHRCSHDSIAKILRAAILKNIRGRLLLRVFTFMLV